MSSSEGAQYLNLTACFTKFETSTGTIEAAQTAQTQRWNTKTSEMALILVVQRYLKRLNGQEFDNKELVGMRFGPIGLRGKFYDAQKGSVHIGKMVVIL